jgi:hypothetical protein
MEVVPLAVLPSFFESDFPNRSFWEWVSQYQGNWVNVWCVIRCIDGCLIAWANLDWSLWVWYHALSSNCTSHMTGSNSDRHIHIWERFWERLVLLYGDLKFSLPSLLVFSEKSHFDSSFRRNHTSW